MRSVDLRWILRSYTTYSYMWKTLYREIQSHVPKQSRLQSVRDQQTQCRFTSATRGSKVRQKTAVAVLIQCAGAAGAPHSCHGRIRAGRCTRPEPAASWGCHCEIHVPSRHGSARRQNPARRGPAPPRDCTTHSMMRLASVANCLWYQRLPQQARPIIYQADGCALNTCSISCKCAIVGMQHRARPAIWKTQPINMRMTCHDGNTLDSHCFISFHAIRSLNEMNMISYCLCEM